jgi:hypothetical protein
MEYYRDEFTYEGEVVAKITREIVDGVDMVTILGDIEYEWTPYRSYYEIRGFNYEVEHGNEWIAALINVAKNYEDFVFDDELTNKVLELRELLRYKYECVKNHVYNEYRTCIYTYPVYYDIMGSVVQMGDNSYNMSDEFLRDAELDDFKSVAESVINEQKRVVKTAMPSTIKSARNRV